MSLCAACSVAGSGEPSDGGGWSVPEEPAARGEGCADEGTIEIRDGRFVLLRKIHFWTDGSQIMPESQAVVDAIAAAMHCNPRIDLVEIQGHADERGSDDYNVELTRIWAAVVRRALIDRGVEPDRMRSAGYGERCPVDPRHSVEAWDRNRRVEIVVLREDDRPTDVELVCPAGRMLSPG